jgi:hypothetical protein
MSKLRLSMSVDRLPMVEGVPVQRRGLLVARICVSDDGRGDDVTLIAGRDDQFNHSEIVVMLRLFAAKVDAKYSSPDLDKWQNYLDAATKEPA